MSEGIFQQRRDSESGDLAFLKNSQPRWEFMGRLLIDLAEKRLQAREKQKRRYVRKSPHNKQCL